MLLQILQIATNSSEAKGARVLQKEKPEDQPEAKCASLIIRWTVSLSTAVTLVPF